MLSRKLWIPRIPLSISFKPRCSVALLDQSQTEIEPGDIFFSIAGNRPFQALAGLGKLIGKILRAADVAPDALPRRAPGREHEVGVAVGDALKRGKSGFIVSRNECAPACLKGASGLHRGAPRKKSA